MLWPQLNVHFALCHCCRNAGTTVLHRSCKVQQSQSNLQSSSAASDMQPDLSGRRLSHVHQHNNNSISAEEGGLSSTAHCLMESEHQAIKLPLLTRLGVSSRLSIQQTTDPALTCIVHCLGAAQSAVPLPAQLTASRSLCHVHSEAICCSRPPQLTGIVLPTQHSSYI